MKTLFLLCLVVALALCETPPFLAGASKEAVAEWETLAAGFADLSENEIVTKVNAYVAKHGEIKVYFFPCFFSSWKPFFFLNTTKITIRYKSFTKMVVYDTVVSTKTKGHYAVCCPFISSIYSAIN